MIHWKLDWRVPNLSMLHWVIFNCRAIRFKHDLSEIRPELASIRLLEIKVPWGLVIYALLNISSNRRGISPRRIVSCLFS
jgi:hypothetical protein